MNPIKLDLKDKKICYELDLNARQSLQQIARKVGLSKQVVKYRIERLLDLGVIKGFYTIMDVAKLGFHVFKVYLKFLNPAPSIVDEIVDYFVKNKNVAWVVTCNGEWDLNVVFQVKQTVDFYTIYHEFLYRYRDYVRDKEIAIPVEAYQFRRAYVLGHKQDQSKYDTMMSPTEPLFDGDSVDWDILKLLASDAKMELQEMAARLKMSSKTVSARIKSLLERGVIQSFRAMFDVSLLGYQYFKVFVGLRSMDKAKESEMFTWLRMNPHIIYITKSIAKADYEFEMQAQGREEFHTILREYLDRFKDNVRYVESLHYFKEHKFLYIPEVTPIRLGIRP